MVIDPKYTKEVSSSIIVQTEENDVKSILGGNLGFTLCDRTSLSDKKGNYFVSFGLPTDADQLGTGSTLSLLYPELQQMNVDQVVIIPIAASNYSEFIDGRSITMSVPQHGGAFPVLSAITLYSSTYTSDKTLKSETSPLLGDNICFLFSDDINRPYTGSTVDEMGLLKSMSSHTSWNPNTNNFLTRPSAIQYQEVKRYLDTYNAASDTRPNGWYSVSVGTSYPDNRAGYNYDIPCGFVVLDKGYVVLTHSAITSNIPWTSGLTQNAAPYTAGPTSGKTGIYFTGLTTTGANAAELDFEDINTSFKNTAVCLALPKEFGISNNNSWNRQAAIDSMNANSNVVGFDPIYITTIGLVNSLGEVVGIAKLSEPYQKSYTSVFTISVDLEF